MKEFIDVQTEKCIHKWRIIRRTRGASWVTLSIDQVWREKIKEMGFCIKFKFEIVLVKAIEVSPTEQAVIWWAIGLIIEYWSISFTYT